MATRKDLLKAQSFISRRMIAAFVDRDPDDPTPPLRRIGTATFVSVLIGVVLLAGTALIGMLGGGASAATWAEEDGVILSDHQSGMLFVYSDKQLTPMADVASARLKAAGENPSGPPRVIDVSTESLRGIEQQPMQGITGAPRQLPAAKDLEGYPVRVCSTAPSGRGRYLTLEFGNEAQVSRDISFVAKASDGKEFLVSGGKTHALYSRPGESSGLAQDLPIVEPGDSWIYALPSGLPIDPITIEGFGEPARHSPRQLTIGQMVVVKGTDSSPDRYYVQLDRGLSAISFLDMKLVMQVNNVDRQPVEISDADLARYKNPDVESVSHDGVPMYELEGPPGYTSLQDASVCATFTEDDPSRVALSVGQTTPEIPNSLGAPRGDTFDLITTPPLDGALLRNADAVTDQGASTLLLGGKGYAIPDLASRRALGYGDARPLPVPGGLLRLLTPGLEGQGASLSLVSVAVVEQ